MTNSLGVGGEGRELDEQQQREVAANLDATPALLPYLDELLADLPALGSNWRLILDTLSAMNLPVPTRALDLACGKGVVSLGLATTLGWTVEGVDLYAPFIARAERRARAPGVAERCRFRAVDMRQALAEAEAGAGIDIVIYASVGALGRHDHVVAALRRAVRVGGLMVVDDGFLRADAAASRAGYEHYVGLEETRRWLRSRGDRIVHETIFSRAALTEHLSEETELIRRRAETIAAREPAAAAIVREFVAHQEEECATLEACFVNALWILERGS